jgi:hypothetical protein
MEALVGSGYWAMWMVAMGCWSGIDESWSPSFSEAVLGCSLILRT